MATLLGRDSEGRVVDIFVGPVERDQSQKATAESAIPNVTRSGSVAAQVTALQNKVDAILDALRAAGVIQK